MKTELKINNAQNGEDNFLMTKSDPILSIKKSRKPQLKIVGNGKNEFFNKLKAMLPKAKPDQIGVIIPELKCQGMYAIVTRAL